MYSVFLFNNSSSKHCVSKGIGIWVFFPSFVWVWLKFISIGFLWSVVIEKNLRWPVVLMRVRSE
jgi:hypothetical protein